jgi:hypothetical protein
VAGLSSRAVTEGMSSSGAGSDRLTVRGFR